MVEEIDRIMTGDGEVCWKLGAALRAYRDTEGPVYCIAHISGVSDAVLSNLVRDVGHIASTATADRIARALGYRLTFERLM